MTDHVIYKYTLSYLEAAQDVEMPAGAMLLHVESVNDVVCLWVRVKPDGPIVKRRFAIVGTGQPMKVETSLGSYVGTAVILNGQLVWHVFDLGVV